LLGYPHRNKWI